MSWLNPTPPHDRCLRFEPHVTMTPVRLAPSLPVTALARFIHEGAEGRLSRLCFVGEEGNEGADTKLQSIDN